MRSSSAPAGEENACGSRRFPGGRGLPLELSSSTAAVARLVTTSLGCVLEPLERHAELLQRAEKCGSVKFPSGRGSAPQRMKRTFLRNYRLLSDLAQTQGRQNYSSNPHQPRASTPARKLRENITSPDRRGRGCRPFQGCVAVIISSRSLQIPRRVDSWL